MSATTTTPTTGAQPVGNAIAVPPEGAKVLSLTLPFSGSVTTVTVDLSQLVSGKQMTVIQSIFVDNWTGTVSLTCQVQNSLVRIIAPASSQGFYPLPTPVQNPKFVFTSTGAVPVNVTFLNTEENAVVWTNGGSLAAPTVTANQGAAGTTPWPTNLYIGGSPVGSGVPIPVSEQVLDLAATPTTLVSGTGTATRALVTGGQVYNGGSYAIGTQLPLQQNTTGQLVIADATLAAIVSGGKAAVQDATLNSTLLATQGVITPAAAPADMNVGGGVYTAGGVTLTTGQSVALQVDSTGHLLCNIATTPTFVANYSGPVAPSSSGLATAMALIGVEYPGSAPTEFTAGQQGAAIGNAYGALIVDVEGVTPTYSAVGSASITSGTSTNVMWIRGSASKTIRVKRIGFSMTGASAGTCYVQISTCAGGSAFAGPTVATCTNGAHDQNSAAGTALVQQAGTSAVTTSPTAVATLRSTLAPLNGSSATAAYTEFTFGDKGDQCVVLRGTSQWFAVAILLPTQNGNYNGYIEWTEV